MRKVSRNQIPGKDHVTYTRYSLFSAFSRIGTTVRRLAALLLAGHEKNGQVQHTFVLKLKSVNPRFQWVLLKSKIRHKLYVHQQ